MITGSKQYLVSVLLGVVAGLLVVNAYGLFAKPGPAVSAAPSSDEINAKRLWELQQQVNVLKAIKPTADANAKIAELSKELEALQAKTGLPKAEADTRPQENPAEAKAKAVHAWNEMLRTADAEPVQPEWASRTSAAFEKDLATVSSETGLAFGKPDCHSTSCTAEVEWASYDEALDTYDALVRRNYSTNCETTILLPDPPEGTADKPYKTRMLFTKCLEADTVASANHSAR